MAADLHAHRVTALAITPGFLRSEAVLDAFGVTEGNWRDAMEKDPYFAESETPCLVERAVTALAADPNVGAKSGGLFSAWALSREYGLTDVDGRRPDWGTFFPRKVQVTDVGSDMVAMARRHGAQADWSNLLKQPGPGHADRTFLTTSNPSKVSLDHSQPP